MKNLMYAIIPLLASQPAFALEVGDIVRVDRSQIECHEVKQPPCHPGGYRYCDSFDDQVSASAVINGTVAGVINPYATLSNCRDLNSILDAAGNPVPLELTRLTTEKYGKTILRSLTLTLGSAPNGQVQFQGNGTL